MTDWLAHRHGLSLGGAWLSGEISVTPQQLVDQLTSLLNETADPAAYRY
jgi:hypothetical protein